MDFMRRGTEAKNATVGVKDFGKYTADKLILPSFKSEVSKIWQSR